MVRKFFCSCYLVLCYEPAFSVINYYKVSFKSEQRDSGASSENTNEIRIRQPEIGPECDISMQWNEKWWTSEEKQLVFSHSLGLAPEAPSSRTPHTCDIFKYQDLRIYSHYSDIQRSWNLNQSLFYWHPWTLHQLAYSTVIAKSLDDDFANCKIANWNPAVQIVHIKLNLDVTILWLLNCN